MSSIENAFSKLKAFSMLNQKTGALLALAGNYDTDVKTGMRHARNTFDR